MRAPGITPPLASVTTPVITPISCCDQAAVRKTSISVNVFMNRPQFHIISRLMVSETIVSRLRLKFRTRAAPPVMMPFWKEAGHRTLQFLFGDLLQCGFRTGLPLAAVATEGSRFGDDSIERALSIPQSKLEIRRDGGARERI